MRNKEEDLIKLADHFMTHPLYFGGGEWGGVGQDCKRPFGNSDVVKDIMGIIGWEAEFAPDFGAEQHNYAVELHVELAEYLPKRFNSLLKTERCMEEEYTGVAHVD